MKIKTFKNLFIYLLLFTPLSIGMISCSGNDKSNTKFKEEITADIISPIKAVAALGQLSPCLLYTSPSPRDLLGSRMPSSA